MAISYVGGVEGGRAGSTSTTTQSLSGTLTGGSNTSPSTGDLVVVFCATGSDGTGTPTSQTISGNNSGAYNALTFQQSTSTTYDSSSQVSYIIQGGSVDTSITIPSSANARNAQRWIVHVFRGVDASTPLDVTSTYATGTATGRPNPALIAPTTAGAWICAFYASAAATGAAYTAPTDFATNWLGGTTADTADCMTGGGYYTGWTSGNYDPAAITAGGTTNAADSWTATTIALRPALPAFTQAAFRFYADGTETGSTALEAQDTNHTADVSSGDYNFQLRTRLQETAGNPGDATDDYQLQYELNDSGTYYDVGDSALTLHSGTSDPGTQVTYTLYSGSSEQGVSQSITISGTGKYLDSVQFRMHRLASPTGSISAKLYAHSGTFGTSSVPTGSVLATSDSITAASLGTSHAWVEFTFTGANKIALSDATNYVLTLEYSGGDESNQVRISRRTVSETPGNSAVFNGTSWAASANVDLYHKIYTVTPQVIGYNSASLTDGNATTNRLGAGTGSFVAGKISEDGLVDDLQITASNYTELLYSLTIDSDAVADNDTLDFRVLRNGATTGMTYTVTPRITIEETVGGSVSVTPGNIAITTSLFAPSVVATNNQTVGTASPTALTTSSFAPSILINQLATPGITTLTTSSFAPGVAATANVAITTASPTAIVTSTWAPGVVATANVAITFNTTALTTTSFAPTATVTNDQTVTPSTTALTTTGQTIAIALSDNKSVVPATASLTTATFIPGVSLSDNKTATPDIATLTISQQTPTAKIDYRSTPNIATTSTSTFAPTITATDNKTATPTTLSLTTAQFAPTVAATANVVTTPNTVAMTTNTWVPGVAFTAHVAMTPSTASLTTTGFAPTVTTTNHVFVTPNTADLAVTLQQPSVLSGDNKEAVPGTLSLTTTTFAPTITLSDNKLMTPTTASFTTAGQTPNVTVNQILTPGVAEMLTAMFAPTATQSDHQTITPNTATLTTSTYEPTVTAGSGGAVTTGFRYYNGSVFALKPIKYFNGSTWVTTTVKRYNGTTWVALD